MKNTETVTAALTAAQAIPDPELSSQVTLSIVNNNDIVGMVTAFHSLYECPDDTAVGTTVGLSHMSPERLKLRMDLIEEEYQRELVPAVEKLDEVEVADALGDIIYVCVGMALECGIDLRAVLGEIQASNMTKLGEDGKVIRRADGKVLKGPNYVKPNIKAVLKYRDAN